jgi:GNAT superfamily N-acetyltransferase
VGGDGTVLRFRRYGTVDREGCLTLFDANCPAAFAPNERGEYEAFLDAQAEAEAYEVCVMDDEIVGAFGLGGDGALRLRWIMVHPQRQGRGIGTSVMDRVREAALAVARDEAQRGAAQKGGDSARGGGAVVQIAASHRSAPFFARFGARPVRVTPDGWGPGMHRIDMELTV